MLFLSVSMGIPFHEVRQWSAAEILLYQVYYKSAPWGEDRADIRNAMQMSQTANMHRERGAPAIPYTDFMPFLEKEEKTLDEEGLKTMFMGLSRKK